MSDDYSKPYTSTEAWGAGVQSGDLSQTADAKVWLDRQARGVDTYTGASLSRPGSQAVYDSPSTPLSQEARRRRTRRIWGVLLLLASPFIFFSLVGILGLAFHIKSLERALWILSPVALGFLWIEFRLLFKSGVSAARPQAEE